MLENEYCEYLKDLFSFASKNSESEAQNICSRYPDFCNLLHVDRFAISESVNLSENSKEILALTAALTSRRITDNFKIGKYYLQNQIEELIIGLFFGCTVETVYALFLDEKERLVSIDYLGEGTVNSSSVPPRKIVEIGTRCKAKYAILAHNHPCGTAKPSNQDMSSSTFVASVLSNAGMKLFGHYIVSGFEICDCYPRAKDNKE